MPRLSANISMLFAERPFLDRFAAAAAAGFSHVECQFPHEEAPADVIADRAAAAGVAITTINADAGDRAAGELGLAVGPQARFRDSIDDACDYARTLGCWRIHVLAGQTPTAMAPTDREDLLAERFAWAADRLDRDGLTLLIEPLNAVDRPGYGLTAFDAAARILARVARPNARLLFDIYHAARSGLDPVRRLGEMIDLVGHVQVASAADRGEPLPGDRVEEVVAVLESHAYAGFIGCEYQPRAGTLEGLGWAAPYLPGRAP